MVQNQKKGQEENKNYITQIKRDTGLSTKAADDGINVLEQMGIIEQTKKVGRRKIYLAHSGIVENTRLDLKSGKKKIGELI